MAEDYLFINWTIGPQMVDAMALGILLTQIKLLIVYIDNYEYTFQAYLLLVDIHIINYYKLCKLSPSIG